MNKIRPTDDLAVVAEGTHTITGWPLIGPCPNCGARAVMLGSTWDGARYECRGTPAPDSPSDYGIDDHCEQVFKVRRTRPRVR